MKNNELLKDRFLIKKFIGKGSNSTVYLGYDNLNRKNIAIKELSVSFDEKRLESVLRFKREVNNITKLNHPDIIKIHDLIEEDDKIFLIMEYFEGIPLNQCLNQINLLRAVKIAIKVLDALQYVHKNEIIHKDLKPGNLLINENGNLQIKIIDFGLAYLMDLRDIFKKGTIIDSLKYLAPEQTGFLRRAVDNRSDLYSIGIILYELITGKSPFNAQNAIKLIHKHLSEKPVKIKAIKPDIPEILNKIITKLLSKEPSARYQSASGLRKDLEYFLLNPEKNFELGLEDQSKKINYQIPFIGNKANINKLLNINKNVAAGNTQTVLVKGVSGSGKTKLIETFQERILHKSFFFIFKCTELTKKIPYEPFINFTNELYKETSKTLEKLKKKDKKVSKLEVLRDIFPMIDNIIQDKRIKTGQDIKKRDVNDIYSAVSFYLKQSCSEKQNYILFIDDIQWLDKGSLELLNYLVENIEHNTNLLIILNFNQMIDEPLIYKLEQNLLVHKIEVKLLEENECIQFVNSMLNSKVEQNRFLFKKVHDISLGNPFFILEIVKTFIENKALFWEKNKWCINSKLLRESIIKKDVSIMLKKRLDDFSRNELDILSIASVINKEINIVFLEQILSRYKKETIELNLIISTIDKARNNQIIIKKMDLGLGKYGFIHDKVLEILKENMTFEEEEKIHELCALVLEEKYKKNIKDGTYEIVYHYNKTGNTKKKLFYNELAYQKALAQSSYNEVIYYLQYILDFHTDNKSVSKEIIQLFILISDCFYKVVKIEDGFSYLNKVLGLAKKNKWYKEIIAVKTQFGYGYYLLNNFKSSLEYFREAINLSKKIGEEVKLSIANRLTASSLLFSSKFIEAKEYFTKAIKYADQDEFESLIPAYGLKIWNEAWLGNIDESRKLLKKIKDIIKRTDNRTLLAQAYHYISIGNSYVSMNYEKSLEYAEKSFKISREINYVLFEYSSLCSRLLALIHLKRYDAAKKIYDDALKLSKEKNIKIGLYHFHMEKIDLLLMKKQFKEAAELSTIYLKQLTLKGERFCVLIFLKAIAIYAYYTGDYLQCIKIIDEAIQLDKKIEVAYRSIFFHYFKQQVLTELNKSYEESKQLKIVLNTRKGSQFIVKREIDLIKMVVETKKKEEKIKQSRSINLKYRYVGRKSELKEIHKYFDALKTNQPQFIIIKGHAGSGKKAFVETFISRIKKENVILSAYKCQKTTSNIPYSAFYYLLNNLYYSDYEAISNIDFLEPKEREILFRIFPFLSKERSNYALNNNQKEMDITLVLNSITKLFLNYGNRAYYLLFFIDDVRWIDSDSYELINYLSKNLKSSKVMFIITQKEEYSKDSIKQGLKNLKTIQMPHLSKSDVKILISELLTDNYKITEQQISQIYKSTMGNPFFIIETIKTLVENKILFNSHNQWEMNQVRFDDYIKQKTDISEILVKRLNRLDKKTLSVLSIASVIGKTFELTLLEKVIKKNKKNKKDEYLFHTLIPVIDNAIREQIIDETSEKNKGDYEFTHEKLVDVLQHQLSIKKAKEIHLICAEILENQYQDNINVKVYEIAYHYNNTDNYIKQIKYNELAYKLAFSQNSINETIYYLKKIIDYLIEKEVIDKETIHLNNFFCSLLYSRGMATQSFKYLNTMLKVAEENKWQQEIIKINLNFGQGYYVLNNFESSLEFYKKALDTAKKINEEIKSGNPYRLIGSSYFFSAEFDKAEKFLTKAIQFTDTKHINHLILSFGIRLWAYIFLGEIDLAKQDINKIEILIKDLEDPIIKVQALHCCAVGYSQGSIDCHKAKSYAQKAYDLAVSIDFTLFQYSTLAPKLHACTLLNEYQSAENAYELAMELSKTNNIFIGIHYFHAFKVELLLRQKKFYKAKVFADEILKDKVKITEKFTIFSFYKAIVAYEFFTKNYKKCLKIINEVTELSKEIDNSFNLIFFILLKARIHEILNENNETVLKLIKELIKIKKGFHIIVEKETQLIELIEKAIIEDKFEESHSFSFIKEKLQLENIIKTSQLISTILDIDTLLNEVVEKILEVTGAERGIISLLKENKEPDYYLKNINVYDKDIDIIRNILEKVKSLNKGIFYSYGMKINSIPSNFERYGIKSFICIPFKRKEKVLGAIYLDSKLLENLFKEDDIELLDVFTSQVGISVENARLHNKLIEQYKIIKQQFTDSIEIILSLVANTSSRLYDISHQVAIISNQLAKKVGLNEFECENIRIASLLHDLGMIGIIENMISSGKKMTKENLQLLKTHPQKSVNLIEKLYHIDDIKDIILQHHEKYNGTGYPARLKGNKINPGGRILKLVDDFVLMLSKREFQILDKKDKIIKVLEEEKGKAYDPDYVEKLIELIHEKDLIYIVNQKDIKKKKTINIISWTIPSNVNFEPIIVGKIIEEVELLALDPELIFSIDYSLCEIIRNAIIHGNKYDESKKVKITMKFEAAAKNSILTFTVLDEGEGMNISEHNRFSESRQKLFSIITNLKSFKENESLNNSESFDECLMDLNMFKAEYYTDFNTFRQLEEGELTGGVGLLYVKKTFNEVEFKNIIKSGKIQGTKVTMVKIL